MKFKVGDKVKIINASCPADYGKIQTIRKIVHYSDGTLSGIFMKEDEATDPQVHWGSESSLEFVSRPGNQLLFGFVE